MSTCGLLGGSASSVTYPGHLLVLDTAIPATLLVAAHTMFLLVLLALLHAAAASDSTSFKAKASLTPLPKAYARAARGEVHLTFTNASSIAIAFGSFNVSGLASDVNAVVIRSASGRIALVACGGPADIAPKITVLTSSRSYVQSPPTCASLGVSRAFPSRPLPFALVAQYGSLKNSEDQVRRGAWRRIEAARIGASSSLRIAIAHSLPSRCA